MIIPIDEPRLIEKRLKRASRKKTRRLKEYVGGLDADYVQRSPEWFALRKNTIGGSEIAIILGLNPYSSLQKMIAGKIGIDTFNGNTACRWGTIFEHVTEQWTKLVLQMNTIEEAGSIPGVIDRQRYSPDGLGIVKLLDCNNKLTMYTVLFEFKAPLNTLPNNKIPKHYIPQIQTGLLSIKIANCAIFVNNCYRKCALADLKYNGVYDTVFHAGDYKKRKYGLSKEAPLACGIMCFYQTKKSYNAAERHYEYDNETESDNEPEFELESDNDTELELADESDSEPTITYEDHDMDILINSADDLIDLGGASQFIVDRILKLYDEKRIRVVYYPIQADYNEVNGMEFITTHELETTNETIADPVMYGQKCINQFKDKCQLKKLYPIGFMPWKLMRSDVILESRDVDWLNTIKEPLTNALKVLNHINNASNPIMEYYNTFPNLKESQSYLDEVSDLGGLFKS